MTQVLVDELTTFSQKWHMKILFYYNRKNISFQLFCIDTK